MPRRKVSLPKPAIEDPRYHHPIVGKFIRRMMLDGKRSVSTKILYDAMDILKEKTGKDELEVFLKALDNVKPVVEVKSRRVGGSTYQVPVEVRESRRDALAMRWLIKAAQNKTGKEMSKRLADELLDSFNNTGTAIKKKEDTHRMAEANKAFAHYRW